MELIYQWGGGGEPGVQLYFCTFLVSTFLQNPGRLEQKCTLKMYETSEISRTCVLNAVYGCQNEGVFMKATKSLKKAVLNQKLHKTPKN